LEDAEEKIKTPEYTHKAHDYLETTDMPAEDRNAKEKGSNGELYKCCV
jgi:hypothetical protein